MWLCIVSIKDSPLRDIGFLVFSVFIDKFSRWKKYWESNSFESVCVILKSFIADETLKSIHCSTTNREGAIWIYLINWLQSQSSKQILAGDGIKLSIFRLLCFFCCFQYSYFKRFWLEKSHNLHWHNWENPMFYLKSGVWRQITFCWVFCRQNVFFEFFFDISNFLSNIIIMVQLHMKFTENIINITRRFQISTTFFGSECFSINRGRIKPRTYYSATSVYNFFRGFRFMSGQKN